MSFLSVQHVCFFLLMLCAAASNCICRYAYPITCTGFSTDGSGRVTELQATYESDLTAKKPPKGVLNWVGQPAPGQQPPTFEARLYDVLFKSSNPASAVRHEAGGRHFVLAVWVCASTLWGCWCQNGLLWRYIACTVSA